MRTLTYVPIIHSEADLGALGAAVKERFTSAFGDDQWERRKLSIDAMWASIRGKLLAPKENGWKQTRVYQDGLPVCGKELEIVKELAGKGSANHQIVLDLVGRGATLMGTEDGALLVRDYQRIQKLAKLAQVPVKPADILAIKREGDELLRARDVFMAKRITSTLGPSERGILFIGLLHRVDELIGGDIRVQNLIFNLPVGAEPLRNL